MKLFAQIVAVIGALSMLVGFVVYSQQKADLAIGYLKARQAETSTNMPSNSVHPPVVAPGSKSRAPLLPREAPVVARQFESARRAWHWVRNQIRTGFQICPPCDSRTAPFIGAPHKLFPISGSAGRSCQRHCGV